MSGLRLELSVVTSRTIMVYIIYFLDEKERNHFLKLQQAIDERENVNSLALLGTHVEDPTWFLLLYRKRGW